MRFGVLTPDFSVSTGCKMVRNVNARNKKTDITNVINVSTTTTADAVSYSDSKPMIILQKS
jgi:hypothetical protein